MTAAWSDSSPRSQQKGRDVAGSLARGGIGATKTLALSPYRKIEAGASFTATDSSEEEDGLTLFEDRLRVARGSFLAAQKFGSRIKTTAALEVSLGLDLLDAGGDSRALGQAKFEKVSGTLGFEGKLPLGFKAKLSTTGQLSDDPLLFGEEFAFGGGKYGRGYDYGEIMGDSGAAGYIELVHNGVKVPGTKKVMPYLFADAGFVDNLEEDLAADLRTLFSTGGGIRIRTDIGLGLTYEAALPLSDAPYTEEDEDVRHRVELSFQRQN